MMGKKRKNKSGAGRPVEEWTPERVKLLKKLYPTIDNESAAKQLKVSISALRNAAMRFGIKKSGWTEKDIQTMKDNFHLPYQAIADKLGKTRWAVINKARELKLTPVNK